MKIKIEQPEYTIYSKNLPLQEHTVILPDDTEKAFIIVRFKDGTQRIRIPVDISNGEVVLDRVFISCATALIESHSIDDIPKGSVEVVATLKPLNGEE